MSDNIKQHLQSALRVMMRPIIRMLLRNGVTYKEFTGLCKSIYVETAAEEYGIRGRSTNVSRISVLTGIDRKEVKRIKDLLNNNEIAASAQQHQDRITRMLTAWHHDPDFVDSKGKPKTLTVDEGDVNFGHLAKRFGGDVPAQTLLKELSRLGLIKVEDNRVEVLQRYYFPASSDPKALVRAGSVISELGETLFHNLYKVHDAGKKDMAVAKFERRASNNSIDPKAKLKFYEFLNNEGQAFLERADVWLSEHEMDQVKNNNAEPIRLGVSVFGFDQATKNQGTNHEQ